MITAGAGEEVVELPHGLRAVLVLRHAGEGEPCVDCGRVAGGEGATGRCWECSP